MAILDYDFDVRRMLLDECINDVFIPLTSYPE